MSEESLHRIPRWIPGIVALLAAAWLSYAGIRHAVANHYAISADTNDWDRAARIEPGNPENWYRLGRDSQLNFDHADLPLAISDYRRAVQLNPPSPYYKLDLATALETSGDNTEAEKYFQAAQQNYPLSAEVSWRYGNFLLRQQRLPEAYAEIHRTVVQDHKFLPLAISRVWHSEPDVQILLDRILPGTPEGDWESLAFLSNEKQATAALTVWNHLIARQPAMDWKKLFPFIDMLVSQERYDDAESVWRRAIAGDDIPSMFDGRASLIFDGGFEKDISGGGFGWQQRDVHGSDFDFDTDEKHSGARSARVIFDGSENLDYHDLFQFVIVSPGTHYRFHGYLHTDQVMTDSGMRFEIVDPKDPKSLDVLTPNETGSIPWTLEEVDFTTGPHTRLIRVQLTRKPSQRLDNRTRGTVWVDDVGIIPAGPRS